MAPVRSGDFSTLTEVVVLMLLEGNNPFLEMLRNQVKSMKDIRTEFTGHGFFSTLSACRSLQIMNADFRSRVLMDVDGLDEDGVVRVGFQLFVSDGLVSTLEGFAWAQDEWPDVPVTPMFVSRAGARYTNSATRDCNVLEGLPKDSMIVTRDMLDATGSKPLPDWPPLWAGE